MSSETMAAEQCDRDAAADYLESIGYANVDHVTAVRKGKHDRCAEVQMLAAHRIAAEIRKEAGI